MNRLNFLGFTLLIFFNLAASVASYGRASMAETKARMVALTVRHSEAVMLINAMEKENPARLHPFISYGKICSGFIERAIASLHAELLSPKSNTERVISIYEGLQPPLSRLEIVVYLGLSEWLAHDTQHNFYAHLNSLYGQSQKTNSGFGIISYFYGRAYELGAGVPQNTALAIKWYTQAMKAYNSMAGSALARLIERTPRLLATSAKQAKAHHAFAHQFGYSESEHAFLAKQLLKEPTSQWDDTFVFLANWNESWRFLWGLLFLAFLPLPLWLTLPE